MRTRRRAAVYKHHSKQTDICQRTSRRRKEQQHNLVPIPYLWPHTVRTCSAHSKKIDRVRVTTKRANDTLQRQSFYFYSNSTSKRRNKLTFVWSLLQSKHFAYKPLLCPTPPICYLSQWYNVDLLFPLSNRKSRLFEGDVIIPNSYSPDFNPIDPIPSPGPVLQQRVAQNVNLFSLSLSKHF